VAGTNIPLKGNITFLTGYEINLYFLIASNFKLRQGTTIVIRKVKKVKFEVKNKAITIAGFCYIKSYAPAGMPVFKNMQNRYV
jgi:hypothetical protein